jgi:hypothetical protein
METKKIHGRCALFAAKYLQTRACERKNGVGILRRGIRFRKNKPLEFFERKLQDLKTSKGKLSRFTKTNEKAMHASYLISLRIAQARKSHTIGESLGLPAKRVNDAVDDLIGDNSSKGFCFPITRLHAG